MVTVIRLHYFHINFKNKINKLQNQYENIAITIKMSNQPIVSIMHF